jgi:hypothetical protein
MRKMPGDEPSIFLVLFSAAPSRNHKPTNRKLVMRLSDILANGSGQNIRDLWETTQSAGEMGPAPPGEYICHIVAGELETSRSNATPGYKLTFRVVEGDLVNREAYLSAFRFGMAFRELLNATGTPRG